MSLSTTQTAGIDIGKAYLDIALYPSGAALRLANDSDGHSRLLHWLIEH